MRLAAMTVAVATWLMAPSALAVSVDDVPNPRARGAWVSDTNDMIPAPTEARIEEAITAFERERGVEIAVVCVDAVDSATPKDFATQLFNRWGIGKAGKDDGLLVLMVLGERRLEMETGYGLEPVLTDGWLKRMQEDEMIPFFKAGDYGTGIEAGVKASITRLRAHPEGVLPAADPPPRAATPRTATGTPGGGGGDWSFLLYGGAIAAMGGGYGAWRHRRNRTCPECRIKMLMLSEEEDDQHLDEGRRKEEALGAVDYQFFHCPQCPHTRIIRKGAWLSGFARCGRCSYKTSRSTSSTILSATYDTTGVEEITTHCEHCGHHHVRQRTTPKLTRTSSSGGSRSSFGGGGSSGGGSSFGGGRSGGGGAGSSW